MNLSLTTLNRVFTYPRLNRYRTWFARAIWLLAERLMYGNRDEPYQVISRLGQRLLAGLALTTSTIGDLIPTDPAKAVALTTDLNQSIRTTVGDIRRLVYDLRSPALDELGLVAAIQERAARYSTPGGLRVVVEADKQLPPLPAAVESRPAPPTAR